VQIAIGLGGEAGDDAADFTFAHIALDDLAQKVAGFCLRGGCCRCGNHPTILEAINAWL
jgi:hypothetical protein